METIGLRERLRGGVYGMLVGDALGVPYEFHRALDLPPQRQIEMTPPPGFRRSHASVPPGTWSDDGAQALVLLESLLRVGRLDADDVADGWLRWREHGWYAVDGHVFDIGIQTSAALDRIRRGTSAGQAGSTMEGANGNGSLMRVLPLALWHQGTDAELVADARAQSLPTHGHVRSVVCCQLYCLWARRLLRGVSPAAAWREARQAFDGLFPDGTPEHAELHTRVLPDGAAYRISGGGYVVESLRAAAYLLGADAGDGTVRGRPERPLDYERVVREAVKLGDDTDTTACIAGGVAGIVVGEAAIPARWRETLRGAELVEPLVDALAARHTGSTQPRT